MPKAEGKRFKFLSEKHIDTKVLEVVNLESRKQEISIESKEFSAVCPFSGLPDIAKVNIEYTPHGKIIELKSLKYYFNSFRSVGIYQEKATARIFEDLWQILSPVYLKVITTYNTRGGIDVICKMKKHKTYNERFIDLF